MDALRWILLIIALVIMATIYLVSRARQGKSRAPRKDMELDLNWDPDWGTEVRSSDEIEPAVADELEDIGRQIRVAPSEEESDLSTDESAAITPRDTSPVSLEEKLVYLYVVARQAEGLSQATIDQVARDLGLQFDERKIYHHYDNKKRILYSLANLLEPGTFSPEDPTAVTKGVVLYLQLPSKVDGVAALEAMLTTAQEFKQRLNAELRDANRSVLTGQTIGYLREEVITFCRMHAAETRR